MQYQDSMPDTESGLRRYHRSIGIPANIDLAPPEEKLVWSFHARQEAHKDGYTSINDLPTRLSRSAECIEVWLHADGSVYRRLFRQTLNKVDDICLVLEGLRVITCWTNAWDDTHPTLDQSKYDKVGEPA